ncbi:hypothetical protein, partial [Aeromicrobium sp. 50.2.37]|uniref:hypothetical protein n=1 Tax=Aeromicrobium sp. 50.2.37 TaxID=2969305 RepID=UPI0021502A9F
MTIDGWLARAGLAVGVLGMVLVPAACSMTGPDSDGPVQEETAPEETGRSTPIPEDPTLTAKPPGGSQRVTGVVERSTEDRCLTLAAPGRTWVLTGAVAGPEGGDRRTRNGPAHPPAP